MAKLHKLGMYGERTRKLQFKLSQERLTQTQKIGNVYLYLGSRTNINPTVNDIQIKSFMEVPDRAYAAEPVSINLYFEQAPEQAVDLSRYGIVNPMAGEQIMKIHVSSYECLGRPLLPNDIIEIPFFVENCTQKAIWEVTDVDRSQEAEKFFAVVYASPANDDRGTREIPLSKSNSDELDFIMAEQDADFDARVPYNDLDHEDLDITGTPPDKEKPYDPQTNEAQQSFLDDPSHLM